MHLVALEPRHGFGHGDFGQFSDKPLEDAPSDIWVGHFPPTPSDPYLRLLFPRVSLAAVKVLSFGLYLPGVNRSYYDVELPVKDLTYRGQLEY